MKNITLEEYREWAHKMLELLPDAQTIAVDECGLISWYCSIHSVIKKYFAPGYRLGKFETHCPWWADSIVVRRWVPEYRDSYYCPCPHILELFYESDWGSDTVDHHRFKHNLVFKTKEEAIARAKQMLGVEQ